MHTLALVAQKGGVGKTTIGLGLAVEAARRGIAAAVVDLDPQANAMSWRDRRAAEDVVVASCVPARLRSTLDTLRRGGVQVVFIDAPGRLDAAMVDAARQADAALVPVRAGVFDAETLPAVRDALALAGLRRAWLVLNGLHPGSTRSADTSRAVLVEAGGIAAAPLHLCQRAEYATAPMSGRMPQETQPGGAAAGELAALYEWTSAQVGLPRNGKGRRG